MITIKMLTLTALLLLTICMVDDEQTHALPSRPERFETPEDVKEYVRKLKDYFDKATPRFGKRFSPVKIPKIVDDTYQEEYPLMPRIYFK